MTASTTTATDRLTQGLGWFSLGLGALELAAPGKLASWLGLEGRETLIRAYGAREIAAGMPTLAADAQVGLIARVAGDALDIATLAPALGRDNPQRRNAAIALALVAGVTLLDIAAAASVAKQRRTGEGRDGTTANA